MAGLLESFPLKERFDVRRLLGAGGFGEVYEAVDLQRNDTVALKILRKADAVALYRFKQEFRTLSLLVHPNLVTLYELIAEDEQWFLTMELITGGSFLDYVRPLLIRPSGGAPISVPTMDSGAVTVADIAAGPRPRSDGATRDPLPFEELRLDRLRPALRQLAEGVSALHQNRVLHLDIKPPNVLVDTNGRVVLVDFGLSQQMAATSERTVRTREVLGTPEFMSPEQAAGEPLTEASDWYSVGAMLYRALTGCSVFQGRYPHVLFDKMQREAAPPSEIVPGLPEDLNVLCRELLRRDPAQRPTGHDVLSRLGSTAGQRTGPIGVLTPARTPT
ncbi:MAG: serine/threonine-protein kinase, partial [Gammaproteobacteria bacterium]